jgi:GNAT superfamily N-acetyltransferase
MADIRIQLLETDLVPAARKLVQRVFSWQSPFERMSFFAFAHRRSPLMQRVMAFAGVSEILNLWIAVDHPAERVVGTTGLYTYLRDAAEAVWLAWFCVAPEARGKGIGSHLLDFSIAEAQKTGRRYLRLYTSDDRREAAAQRLYESRGLRIVGRKRRLFHTEIYRELLLD